jgi:diguanylate cyclase (GGDEF)-like protein
MSLRESALVGTLVWMAALFGILTRPVGFLAAFWPANALLLGVLVRSPRSPAWHTWLLATLGYLAADVLMQDPLQKTMLLTAANLCGVGVGYLIFSRVSSEHRRLESPRAILSMATIAFAAAIGAGIAGSVVNPLIFGGTAWTGFLFWTVTELVSYIVVLPAVLTAPDQLTFADLRRRTKFLLRWRPLGALILSCGVAVFVGGPGAMAIPMPALLWCALTYSVNTSAWLTLALTAWTLVAISTGLLDIGMAAASRTSQMSLRLGVALMSLAPLVTASITSARNALLLELEHRAAHDSLSGLLNRGAFVTLATTRLDEARRAGSPATVLLIDIDHFKAINDTHGHEAGDQVLRHVSRQLTHCVRANDLTARFGGEEFAIFLENCADADAHTIAERIRRICESTPTPRDNGPAIPATVSIGLASTTMGLPTLKTMLSAADQALYRAKRRGRNRVELANAA